MGTAPDPASLLRHAGHSSNVLVNGIALIKIELVQLALEQGQLLRIDSATGLSSGPIPIATNDGTELAYVVQNLVIVASVLLPFPMVVRRFGLLNTLEDLEIVLVDPCHLSLPAINVERMTVLRRCVVVIDGALGPHNVTHLLQQNAILRLNGFDPVLNQGILLGLGT